MNTKLNQITKYKPGLGDVYLLHHGVEPDTPQGLSCIPKCHFILFSDLKKAVEMRIIDILKENVVAGLHPDLVYSLLKNQDLFNNIILIYPEYDLKDEYRKKFEKTLSLRKVEGLMRLWEEFGREIRAIISPKVFHLELKSGQTLADVITFQKK